MRQRCIWCFVGRPARRFGKPHSSSPPVTYSHWADDAQTGRLAIDKAIWPTHCECLGSL